MKLCRVLLGFGAFFVATAAAPAAGQATATGSMTVNGITVPLRHVVAVAAPGTFDQDKNDLVIVLSDVPIQASAVLKRSPLTEQWMTGKMTAILITIQPSDMQVISGNLYAAVLAKSGSQITGNGLGEFSPTKVTADHIAGRMSLKNFKSGNINLSYDATFSAPIEGGRIALGTENSPKRAQNAEAGNIGATIAGAPLPADGGEPGKAYLAYVQAIQSGSVEAIKKYLPKSERAMLDGPGMKEGLAMLKDFTPKDAKVTGGVSDGKKAALTVTSSNGKKTVQMVYEADGWKFVGDN
jgi:hypothetical protein